MTHRHIASALLIACVSTACGPPSADFPPVDVIEGVLSAAVRRGPGTQVSLDTVIQGEWRALYVISPYTPTFRIMRCVGASVPTRGIQVNDGITLLVLEPTRGAVRSLALPRRVSFAPEASNRIYPRGSATFEVQEPHPGSWDT